MFILKALDLFFAAQRKLPTEIDHFSINKVGSKHYVYAHPQKGSILKIKIGSYKSYEQAKNIVDNLLDIRLESYGT